MKRLPDPHPTGPVELWPKSPELDPSAKFNENNPAYTDGRAHALAWREVWWAVKGHFESARDEHPWVHSIA